MAVVAAARRSESDVAEGGAIFLANGRTMEECFSRRLFGFPSGMRSFVGTVRAGMILFLFEYDTRSLHGVFVAVSDGALDIVPHAYASTGKRYPAQVRFEKIWDCEGIREVDFREAMEENYFAKFKFRFGLSLDQVRKLLWLFDSRRKKPTTIRNLPCEGSRRRRSTDYEEGEMLDKSPAGNTVSESSPSCEAVKENSRVSCLSGNPWTLSYFDDGSGVTVLEERLEKLKSPSKDIRTDHGDFIPLDSLDDSDPEIKSIGKLDSGDLGDFIPLCKFPDNLENETESPGNDRIPESPEDGLIEFMPFERYIPVTLMSCEFSGNQRIQKSADEDIAQKFDAVDGNGGNLCVKGLYSDDQVDRSNAADGNGGNLCVKGLYSDDCIDRSSVFARLSFESSDKDKLARETKVTPKKGRGKERRSVFTRLSVASRLRQSIIDAVSDQHQSTKKETELAREDGEDDSESIHAGCIREEGLKGKDTVQDIMGALLQKHRAWRNADPTFEQEKVKSAAKKNVFSRLSWASDSDYHIVNVTVKPNYAEGLNRARWNKTAEQWSERLYSKRSRDDETSNPNFGNEENFEKACISKKLKPQSPLDKRDCVIGSKIECKSEELPQKKLVRQLFDPTSEAKTTDPETGLIDQLPSGGSSKESTGSCDGPTKENTAQDKVTSPEKELKTMVVPLSEYGDKGETDCDVVLEEPEAEDMLVGEFKAGGSCVTGLSDQLPLGGSSKESTGSCDGPTKDNIAQDKVISPDKEVKIIVVIVDKGEADCDVVVEEPEAKDMLVGEFKAIVATPFLTYKRRAKRVCVFPNACV